MTPGQGINAAVHLAGGAVLGVTLVLAACTLAQAAARSRQAQAPDRRPETTMPPPWRGGRDDGGDRWAAPGGDAGPAPL